MSTDSAASTNISSHILDLDADLAGLGRGEAQLKLRNAELLDALFLRGGHHELGFSSFEAYVVERCGRSGSWGRETRRLAKWIRERGLSEIRRAILEGRLSWAAAEVVVRHATRENQAEVLAKAAGKRVRELRAEFGGGLREEKTDRSEDKIRCTRWVRREEILMLRASRILVEYLTGRRANDETFLTALLGEGETSLQSIVERLGTATALEAGAVDSARFEALAGALRERMRATANDSAPLARPVLALVAKDAPLPSGLKELDSEIVERCRELACRNLEIGRLFSSFAACQGWRALGYRSVAEYLTDRVGLSLSSLEHRALLARRVARYPRLGKAIEDGVIGYESALLVTQVIGRWASDALVDAWIERARRRTVKYLREEVRAVLGVVELNAEASRFPPSEADLEAAFEIERKVQSGEILRSIAPQMSVSLVPAENAGGAGKPLQFTLSTDFYAYFLNIEAQFRAACGPNISFITFLCANLWATWLPFLEIWDDKWKHIYLRDRHRCTSPVCERHDVTPHHLEFKAHDGSDAPENLTSGCSWCHLEGIHRGRLRARGEASDLTWTIGRDPILIVRGREKVAK